MFCLLLVGRKKIEKEKLNKTKGQGAFLAMPHGIFVAVRCN
jgi:hypothetical protein